MALSCSSCPQCRTSLCWALCNQERGSILSARILQRGRKNHSPSLASSWCSRCRSRLQNRPCWLCRGHRTGRRGRCHQPTRQMFAGSPSGLVRRLVKTVSRRFGAIPHVAQLRRGPSCCRRTLLPRCRSSDLFVADGERRREKCMHSAFAIIVLPSSFICPSLAPSFRTLVPVIA